MNLNKAMLIGNLTRNPEMRTTPQGQTVCSFGLATNRRWTDQSGQKQEQVEYHNIVAWGKLAEICGQYLVKGKKVYVEGRLQTHKWQGQDGVERTRTEIIMENMQMLDRAGATGPGGPVPVNTVPQPEETPPPLMSASPTDDNEGIKVEAIPF
ncbi:MAG: Single-stranded DNA-binding protein [Parcubacteria group bacterium GW2011_GWC2_45_7]|nr:MAG: Single-stranded DNA-binding protein [Parcubacteria group bacterium GW2011_GWC2_45_7]KKU71908.1 MAG: Single-stranded DNA-binding protein [Parcubacteria group bacterium GW2011_GWA2_47_26]